MPDASNAIDNRRAFDPDAHFGLAIAALAPGNVHSGFGICVERLDVEIVEPHPDLRAALRAFNVFRSVDHVNQIELASHGKTSFDHGAFFDAFERLQNILRGPLVINERI